MHPSSDRSRPSPATARRRESLVGPYGRLSIRAGKRHPAGGNRGRATQSPEHRSPRIRSTSLADFNGSRPPLPQNGCEPACRSAAGFFVSWAVGLRGSVRRLSRVGRCFTQRCLCGNIPLPRGRTSIGRAGPGQWFHLEGGASGALRRIQLVVGPGTEPDPVAGSALPMP